MKKVMLILVLASGFILSGCKAKDKYDYQQACFDIGDSMFRKNQFPTTDDYLKFKEQCIEKTNDIYGK